MGGGGGRDELQRISEEIEAVENEIEELRGEIQSLRNEKSEMDEAIEALGTLESGASVQVPLGGDTHVKATIEDIDEVIVGIGGGYAAERDREQASEILEDKKDAIDDTIDDLTEEIADLESESQELESQAMQQRQQMQQQLQQQLGGLGGGEDDGE
jgi:prefoldin alpha subunit